MSKEYLVTYTSRSVILVRASSIEAAERKAKFILTGGVVTPVKRDVVILNVQSTKLEGTDE